ncbi:YybH family protein [Hymenobacter weizhouensis]|uniref:YybH family protein n=1 Tax=Hymenobacter sp. YIM 151500-1 TaxID=2987689 RepID=UPI002226EC96|nr:nuclear transport factor 2 family protein [Hymenobacter sp. YIM 151500-1]UYZ61501.1 nuclear transport factor 2 family protein [Hymenobacter sp. YIM 151500-1]
MIRASVFAMLGVAFFSSCTPSAKKDEAAVNVHALNQQFITAWNSRNTTQIDTLLADDVQYAQGEAHYSGKPEVAAKWVRETVGTIRDLRLTPSSFGADNSLAYEAGTYEVEVLPEQANQPRGEGEGNFILLWKKDAKNAWKLSYVQLEGLPVRVK